MKLKTLGLIFCVLISFAERTASKLPEVKADQNRIETPSSQDFVKSNTKSNGLHNQILTSTLSMVNMALQHAQRDMTDSMGKSSQNAEESGIVYMPPTFNVDIANLLKLAMQLENFNDIKLEEPRTSKNSNAQKRSGSPLSSVLVNLGGRNYFFSTNQQFTWIDSLAFCHAHGMDLVSMETVEEKDLIVDYIEKLDMTASSFFISGNKIGRSSYMWGTGDTMYYENFGSILDFSSQHCLSLSNKKWHNEHCDNQSFKYYFICEEN